MLITIILEFLTSHDKQGMQIIIIELTYSLNEAKLLSVRIISG